MSSSTFLSVIRVLASLTSTYVRLVPIMIMIKIYKSKSTGQVNIVPLAAQWTSNHLWMLYGYVTNDIFPLLATYAIGDLLSIFYVSFFYYWSTEKRYALKICAVSFTVNVIMAIYAVMGYHLQDHELVINIVGTTAIAASVFFYASPLTTIRKVIRTKNAASIPFEMLLVGALNNILWIIYGTLIHDMLLISPSIISVSLASTQLILYAIYRPRGKNTHNLQAVVPRKEEKDNYKSNSNPMKIHAAEQECPEFVDNQLPTDRIQVKI